MDNQLELARMKLTIRYMAENLGSDDAGKLLVWLRDSVNYLERRVSRENMLQKAKTSSSIHEAVLKM